jgi:hypothetical protein
LGAWTPLETILPNLRRLRPPPGPRPRPRSMYSLIPSEARTQDPGEVLARLPFRLDTRSSRAAANVGGSTRTQRGRFYRSAINLWHTLPRRGPSSGYLPSPEAIDVRSLQSSPSCYLILRRTFVPATVLPYGKGGSSRAKPTGEAIGLFYRCGIRVMQ